MKPVANSLIVALGSALPLSVVLLPPATSAVFASPTPAMETQVSLYSATKPSDTGFTIAATSAKPAEGKFSTTHLPAIALPELRQAASPSVVSAKTFLTANSPTAAIWQVGGISSSTLGVGKTSPTPNLPNTIFPDAKPVSGLAVPVAQHLSPAPNPPTVVVPVKRVPVPAVPTAEKKEPASISEATDTQKKPGEINTSQKKEPASTPETTKKPQTNKKPNTSDTAEKKEPEPTPAEIARNKKLIEADQLYLGGQHAAAEKLYRAAKPPFAKVKEQAERKPPITDPEQLPPAGRVYWRQSQEGMAQKLDTKIFVPLELLVQQYPEFIPGHLRYAEALKQYNRPKEAAKVLEQAASMYPNQADLVRASVEAKAKDEQWLEASLTARQFAMLNPSDPAASEMAALAEKHLARYKQHIRARIRRNTITNIITGALGYALTGSLFGPLTAVDSTVMLLRGESSVGESVAKQAKRQLPLVDDPEVLSYVREVGNKLVTVAGRTDFKYEFYVVMDDSLNAFALPGGKVFVNAGAIAKTNSEAELAGLMAHELSHAVLSHGFQLATQGNLTANLTQYLPLGGTLGDLFVLSYSRDMERQADTLGTRLLAATGYAADGMRNLMVTLNKEDKHGSEFSWLRDHPATKDRVRYLEELIQTNGYNRYAYEGVARHTQMKTKVKKLLAEYKKRKEKKDRRENRNRQPIVDFQMRF